MLRPRGLGAAAALLCFLQRVAAQYDDCTTGAVANIGNGQCDTALNVPSCGYDGGDCCSCTCLSSNEHSCADSVFNCLHPGGCDDDTATTETETCNEDWLGDGSCDSSQNSASCGYDGGDCCECSCVDGPYVSCGTLGFECRDPACFDPTVVAEFPDCAGDWIRIGDGVCNVDTNVASCGYDGGDCCACSCSGSACGYNYFECLDPDASDEFYECEAPPRASLPCSAEIQREWVVDDAAQAHALTAAVNCSGGSFEVEWRGKVIVDEPIYVSHGTTLTVTGTAGSMASIDGNSSTRLFTVVNAALHLEGLNVSYGASMAGGAIAATRSVLTFIRTNFVGNRAITEGGAVFVSDASSVSCAHGTTFIENGAGIEGGAMFASGGSEVSCGGRWLSNSAGARGGALRLQDESSATWSEASVFEYNAAGGMGGALSLKNSSRVSWDAPTDFHYNNAGVFGGALSLGDQCIVSWQAGTSFDSNSAGIAGGALYVQDSSSVSSSGEGSTMFDENQAGFIGGAFAVAGGSQVSWTGDVNTTFRGNQAGDSGGALYVHEGSSVSSSGEGSTMFDENQAGFIGGAFAVAGGSQVSWTGDVNTTFRGNQAGNSGGALAIGNSSQASCTVGTTTTFSGNSARGGVGGALTVVDSSLSLSGTSSFEGNAAIGDPQDFNSTGSDRGGAINLLHATAAFSGPVTFTGNRAGDNGGAVYISESNVLWNAPTTKSLYNFASSGGAMYLYNSNVTWNGQAMMAFNNASDSGGAMYILQSNVSWVGHANFSGNVAGRSGGALSATVHSTLTFDGDATFAQNKAVNRNEPVGSAGALNIHGNTNVVWRGGITLFIGNSVVGLGSALTLSGNSSASWSGPMTKFVDNSAELYWGTLLVTRSEVSWSGETLFEGNNAYTGGAILIYNGSYVGWTAETTFSSNVATVDGGAVACPELDPTYNPLDSTLHMGTTTTFLNNTSGANGGGLSLHGACVLDVDPGVQVSYVGNSAGVAGGAVFVSGAGTGPVFSSGTFVSNSAQVGGAVSLFGSGNSKSASETVPPDPTIFYQCRFVGNRATMGGAIDSAAGYDIVSNSTFEDNSAGTGGAMRLAGMASIGECSFVNNFSLDGAGAVISNIGTISYVFNISFSGNGFNCPAGMFLAYNASRDPYEAVCDGCQVECDGCEFAETSLSPTCEEVIAHSKSSGGKTVLEALSIERGYWRASNSSKTVLACYHADACLGGETGTSDYCRQGYEGPYCAICSEGYTAQIGFVCRKCSSSTAGVVLAVVLAAVALIVAVTVVSYATTGERHGKGRGLAERVSRYIPLQSVKIVIVAWQILTQFTEIANVTYPSVYQTFLNGLNVVNFDLSWILSAGCIVDFDFHDRLLMSTAGPIVAVLFLGCTYATAVRIHRGATETLQIVRHKHVSLVLLLTFFVYSRVSSVLFSTFACEVLDDGKNYLRSDYRIECDSPRHRGFQVYAGFMIVVYTVGIPSFYAGLLFKDGDALRQKDHGSTSRVSSTSDLWKPYKPSVFYYELVECARRILLAGVVVFVYPNSAAQIAITLMIAFAFVLLSEALAPYASWWDHWISRTGHVVVVVSMYVALLLKVDVSDERARSQEVFESVLVAVHVVMVSVVVAETIVMGLALRAEHREDPLPRLRSSSRTMNSENKGREEQEETRFE